MRRSLLYALREYRTSILQVTLSHTSTLHRAAAVFGAAALLLVVTGTSVPTQPQAGAAFLNGTIITMGKAGVLPNHTVLVRGDSIVAVGPSESVQVPAGYERIDAQGRFILPGLMDMHVHLSGEANLLANLRFGVTSVLQMSGQRGDIRDFITLRANIERGATVGPRLFLAGPMFDRLRLPTQTTAYVIPHADSVPALLGRHVAAGYDFVKVHNFTPPDVHRTLVRASPVPVIGHIPIAMTAAETLISGQVMFAHAQVFYYNVFYDASCTRPFWDCMAAVRPDLGALDTLVPMIAKADVFVTANLSLLAAERSNDDDWNAVLADPEFAYLDPGLQARWRGDNPLERNNRAVRRKDIDNQVEFNRALVVRLHQRGVPILAGTDAGVEGLFPGKALHLELRELVAAGLTPAAALETATATPGSFLARYVPRARRLGRVEPGFGADLVMLDADPLTDIGNIARISGTMSRGVWHSRESLDRARGRR